MVDPRTAYGAPESELARGRERATLVLVHAGGDDLHYSIATAGMVGLAGTSCA